MKLVQILARELKEWPGPEYIVQEGDGGLFYAENDKPVSLGVSDATWYAGAFGKAWYPVPNIYFKKATDHATAIVTRADWEAERARIAKPAKKASADGWIRHRGGKCPVSGGLMIQTVMRGETKKDFDPQALFANAYCWGHNGGSSDVMYYRIHKPAGQPEPVTLPEGYGEVITATLESTSGPLEWRDRIHEIDAEVNQRNEAHRKAIEALEEERASFVQRLEDEGLQLFQGKVCGGVQPVEDMSDWRNWKAGDLLSYDKETFGFYVNGDQYAIQSIAGEKLVIDDNSGDKDHNWDADMVHSYFKWHSRPSA